MEIQSTNFTSLVIKRKEFKGKREGKLKNWTDDEIFNSNHKDTHLEMVPKTSALGYQKCLDN